MINAKTKNRQYVSLHSSKHSPPTKIHWKERKYVQNICSHWQISTHQKYAVAFFTPHEAT